MKIDGKGRTRDRYFFAFCLVLFCFGEPVCTQIRYSIPEEVKEGTVVGNVAKDLGLDLTSLTDRRFRVVSGSKDAFFDVNQDNGALYVQTPIDREELCHGNGACTMELKILIENPLEMHYVTVEITDINDHSPVFPEKQQTFEIFEQTLSGRRFQLHTARDPDAGINSIRTYTLKPNDHFEVDIRQSDEDKIPFLVLKKPLDREQKDKHLLLLTAVDGGKPQRSGILNVSIIVLDSNDNRPIFSQEIYQIAIQENIPLGTTIFKLNATDPDEGTNGETAYSLGKTLRRKVYEIFELDNLTGELRIKGLVDYEDINVYKLDIEATDKGTPPLTGESRVIIKIIDVNDNPPEIEVTSVSNTISEDSKLGTVISLISVTDKDSGVNGKIILHMTKDVPFELKPSYKENIYSVVTKGLLDREVVPQYEITIKATDCGEPPLSTFKTLSILVSDVNDNKPHFDQNPLQFYLIENNIAGTSIFSVSATDSDVNDNAAIAYHIVREGSRNDITSFLNINSDNGQICALKSFDFETLKTFQFHVVATDYGSPPLRSNVTVNVFILDQNDNPPVILYPLSSNGSAEGVEEIPRNVNAGHLVTKVRAYDADIGYNGWLLFSLQEVSDHSLFALDRYTGQIRTLRSFTETDEAEHKLVILVKDNGDVSLSATATVTVKLVEPKEAFAASDVKSSVKDDEENNVTFYLMITLGAVSVLFLVSIIVLIAMQCSKSTDYASKYLQETNYDGTLCHSIQYRSGDRRYMLVGPRMSIGSTIVPGSNANTLVLPDRRTPGEFHVVATDSGSPSLSSNVTVNVFILDQNDNPPVILYPLSSNGSAEGVEEIPRNVNAGNLVTKERGIWRVMEQRGCKARRGRLWRVAFVVVLDLLWSGASAQIKYSISEEVQEGTVVGHIAKDLGLDKGALENRGYRIVAGSTEPLFQVNQKDGVLYVNRQIDREEVCERSSACVINLKTVLENPLEIHYVAVEILDVNDHSPVFSEKEKRLEIFESALPGAKFQLQAARDLDVGQFSIQQYKLSHNEHFRIDVKDRGEDRKVPFLVLQKQLDREAAAKHRIQLTAIDGGKPAKSGAMEIIVDVLDVNDNSPVFTQEIYSVTLKENVPVGTVVTQVNATDIDQGANGEIIYSFGDEVDLKLMDLFRIDPHTGEIQVTGQIDYEQSKSYEIDIQASDKGQVPLTADKSVIITVVDVNDNPPEIEVTSFSTSIQENSKTGTTVALISVSDLDSGINGKVFCTIRADVPFTLSPALQENMYAVVTKSHLNREMISHYDVTIVATDKGEPSFLTEKTISVVVSDVNDNSPEFTSSPYIFYISENNAPGDKLFSVKASDRDEGDNALISYHILRSTNGDNKMASFLNINSENGDILALKSFDFETLKKFKFHVVATDSGSPPLTSNVTVNVFILDQNDNPPVILYPLSSNGSAEGVEEIPRNVNAGHLVTKVRAYDADIGYNGWLLFSLQEVSDHSLFALDRYTGQIRTLRSFTETDEAEHKLVILVKDNGNVSLSATATVTVKLVEPKEAFAASDVKSSVKDDEENNVTFYLMITLGAVSVLFLVSIIVLIAMQCSKSTDYASKYLQETNYDGTLCHSIQYRSGDRRYMLVGPRMSIGSTIVPGSNANTLVLPDRRGASGERVRDARHRLLFDRTRLATAAIIVRSRLAIMEQRGCKARRGRLWRVAFVVVLDLLWSGASAQIKYSISEEVQEGTVVGHIAKDLGLDKGALENRGYRIVAGSTEPLFQVNQKDGVLYVNRQIDREEVCERSSACVINLKTVLENPLEIHYVAVEILDVNDHSPVFSEKEKRLEIFESALPGAKFQLQAARDLDVGQFSIQQYKLSHNEHFRIDVKDRGEDRKVPFLVLQKQLDREAAAKHRIQLTAIDGGKPAKSGAMEIIVDVLDVNDNSPVFTQEIYSVTLKENVPVGTVVTQVNATDIDQGANGEIIYSFGDEVDLKLMDLFRIDPHTGEIQVTGQIDYEQSKSYEIDIQASDKGQVPLTADKSVIITVVDVNDNPPEIEVTSFSTSIQENSKTGTTVALISVSDLDSGINGKVFCTIRADVPFTLSPALQENMYAVVTKSHLNREMISHYDVTIVATDKGEPSFLTEKTISVVVSDVNDNSPEFTSSPYIFYISENNAPGDKLFSVKASDRDEGDNALISYHILRSTNGDNKMASFLNINSENGDILALKSFDFETLKKFKFHVVATDSGSPPLTSNVTVNVFILDQNDNPPVILYPLSSNGSAEGVEEIPRNVNAGHLVTKVRAYDADIGYNGWLLFSLQEVSDHSLFALDRYTGQIRTLRSFTETDEAEHKLVILVKDNGNVSLSATATVTVKLVEPKEAFAASDVKSSVKDDEENNVTFYLMITLGAVSVLFLVSIIVLIAMQCSKSTDYASKYLQETNYDGTLCHSIQYRSGDRRYMLVGPRMSIGSTIVPGSNANTLVLPDRRTPAEVRAMEQRGWAKGLYAGCMVTVLLCGVATAQIRYSISEETNEGIVVGNIAKDLGLDKSALKERKYRIVSTSDDPLFRVNQNDGVLYVSRKIDREEVCPQSSTCLINLKTVLENPLEVHYVAVEVLDINDHAPSFPEEEKRLEISESVLPGTRFQLQASRDPDSGAFSVQQYKLTHNDHFRLEVKDQGEDGKIPILVLQKSLDRETVAIHTLVLTALDGGKPPKSGEMSINVHVLDVNDNAPVFTKDVYSVMLSENTPIGTTVMKVNATDVDDGLNGEVVYSFGNSVNRRVFKLFDINPSTGEIIVKGLIDYEHKDKYEIEIQASDKGLAPLTTGKSVIIKIVDVNDNAPEIEVTSFSSSIPEDSRSGSTVALISVNDLDSGLNGKVICSLGGDGPFALSPSLQDKMYSLVTKSPLDREKQSQYDVTIFAKDTGQRSLSSEKTIRIIVSDANDNSPEFSLSPYTFYVTENNEPGASVFSVKAFDQDENENAVISYRILRDGGANNKLASFLNINSENGDILALKSFDFETLKKFQFHVVATDSGSPPLSSNVTVNVFILDQNDNPPVILYPLSSNGSAEGVEEIPRNVNAGHLVTKVRAYDADIGYNGWLLFSLQEVSDHSLFALDRYTGQIRTLRSFTETDEAEHKLVILVKDNGNVSLSATATVTVKLAEPKEAFAASDVKSSVKDDEENNVTFYLMITLGAVSVLFLVSIIVLIAMQCSKSTDYASKYLQETNYDGTLCHSIQYRSGDRRYMLVGPRMSIGSTIVPGSNANTLVLPDRRTPGEGLFTMWSETMEQRRCEARKPRSWWVGCVVAALLWSVTTAQIRYSISEEVNDGTVVGNVAKDLGLDKSSLKERKYRIVSTTTTDPLFHINQKDGILYVSRKIDREEVCAQSTTCLINLKTVLENPLEVHYVAVEVLDINDHSPAFPEREKRLEISETVSPGMRYQLKPARDPDSGHFSVQQYRLSHNDHFRLEVRDKGEDGKIPILVLQKSLDREATTNHALVLTALDGGKPPKSGDMNIVVNVLDSNDNAPVFSQDVYSVTLRENVPIGTTVVQVNATDMDDGQNGDVVYSFGNSVSSTLFMLFEINPSTGEIIVKGLIDYEQKDKYEIEIEASDKGPAPLTTEKSVIIKIVDENDNAPEIEVTSFSSSIPEDSRSGTTVALISVNDLDSGLNGKVICSLGGDGPFALSPSLQDKMYSLVTKSPLDREKQSQYDVTIFAKDAGQPSLSSEKTIRIIVSDANDNSPEFSLSPYTFYVTENNEPGASVFSVKAFDLDENENAVISYHIFRDGGENNKLASFLNINSENGDILALKSFDFETLKKFLFHVVATDSGSPTLTSNVTVNVFILDQNDNPPVILYPLSSNGSAEGVEEIPRNVNAGHLVTKVRAYDADIGYNGWLLFSLQEVSDHSLFALDRYTGQIRTLRSFTETDEAEHKLVILVKDNGNVSLSATATVTVKLVEPKEAFAASDVKSSVKDDEENNVTFYLMITLGAVSVLFLVSIIVLIAMQCSKSTDYASKYLQETNYDGTLCHSIQYRSGDRRYMLVGPRMSIGSTIVPGSNANTLVLPDRRTPGEVSNIFMNMWHE
ncbi:protocadherin Fat 4-like [Genypterus blacodes]|uniref:protocadherin Fat 4-like n=1 Tax=Genypterus blacodes TaxID=154954 RepID=UPI003F7760E1